MSTSSLVSNVYDDKPSTSPGSMPASSRAALMARSASTSSESSRPLPHSVWPMPTMAVASLMVIG